MTRAENEYYEQGYSDCINNILDDPYIITIEGVIYRMSKKNYNLFHKKLARYEMIPTIRIENQWSELLHWAIDNSQVICKHFRGFNF